MSMLEKSLFGWSFMRRAIKPGEKPVARGVNDEALYHYDQTEPFPSNTPHDSIFDKKPDTHSL